FSQKRIEINKYVSDIEPGKTEVTFPGLDCKQPLSAKDYEQFLSEINQRLLQDKTTIENLELVSQENNADELIKGLTTFYKSNDASLLPVQKITLKLQKLDISFVSLFDAMSGKKLP